MKTIIKEYISITIGIALVALGLYFFLIPNDLAVGGVSGLAMVINQYMPGLTIGALMFVLNIVLFVVGFMFIGSSFGVRTMYASFGLSGMIWVLEKLFPMSGSITNDIFLELIFGILIGAIGMGMVFNQNASTGGTDIIAKMLNKYFHLEIGKSLLIADFFITILAGVAFGPRIGMYALLGVIINGYTVDAVIAGINNCKKVEVVSSKGEEIKRFIIEDLNRGATLYMAKGAYTNDEKEIITTVLGKKQFIKLKNHIKEIDKTAFIITYNVHETVGEGFKDIDE
ncbi:YitT family protein [Clostridium estertheticum]|uniref:YitT family protein n=1 Tax=Clostridium estertheticum TaxID=238834 RepID=A0A5N7IYC1_9CLOT|nr:YitT family protein [Clostridium estertheticum]MBW9171285.1 YitT family protein [Clostridium estertheticum]MBX4264733.1 YitT family protein [Clostridium estertheticum]MBX4269767.1 YitT family protein [Clostridium estertheticum]MPQ30798.1 YitT family protein [Clostridium estertheticum]MPQ61474.1 YitT family protein [Clostridium estertheticum]